MRPVARGGPAVCARGGRLAVEYLVDGRDDRAGHPVDYPGRGLAGLPSRPAVCTAESPASTRGLHRALLGGGPDLFGVGTGGRVTGGALHDEGGIVQGDPEQVVEVVRRAPGRLPRLCSRSDWRSRLPGACCSALACLRPVRARRHAVNTGGPGSATLVMESSTGSSLPSARTASAPDAAPARVPRRLPGSGPARPDAPGAAAGR